jgi:hypothetical protein
MENVKTNGLSLSTFEKHTKTIIYQGLTYHPRYLIATTIHKHRDFPPFKKSVKNICFLLCDRI